MGSHYWTKWLACPTLEKAIILDRFSGIKPMHTIMFATTKKV
jgi:hypothetical protein